MFKESYINELNRFELSEDFKAKTIALLQQKQQENAQTAANKKTIYFKPKHRRTIAVLFACAAIAVLSAAVIQYHIGYSMPSGIDQNNNQLDSFTIEDAEPYNGDSTAEFTVKAQYDSGGGFGYEGILLKDISNYDNGNPFSINDTFESLPVYIFEAPTVQQAETETQRLLKALEADSTDEAEITLMEIIYKDGHIATHRDFTVTREEYSTAKFKNHIIPYSYKTSFENGNMEVWISRGETCVSIDYTPLCIDSDNGNTIQQQLLGDLQEQFAEILGHKNSVACADVDYNIYGEENPTYYIYSQSDDYAQNIFNYSVNNTRAFYLSKEESLEDSDQMVLWTRTDSYTKGQELPAINWRTALGFLYEGDYYSSVPYPITEESKVSRIELVYKDAPYNNMLLTRSQICLPFYKFYVEIEEMGIEEYGLEDYGIYYVCAINPAYVEITENYAQFN